jgi:hypothetical protein
MKMLIKCLLSNICHFLLSPYANKRNEVKLIFHFELDSTKYNKFIEAFCGSFAFSCN